MNPIVKAISKIDILGTDASLFFSNNSKQAKSFYGGLLSTGIIILSILGGFLFWIQFLNKNNFTVFSNSKIEESINYSDFSLNPFMIRLSRNKFVSLPDSYYDIKMQMITYNEKINSVEQSFDIDMIKCTENALNGNKDGDNINNRLVEVTNQDSNSLFSSVSNINSYYCPVWTKNSSLYGITGSKNYSYFNILINICHNRDTCEDYQAIIDKTQEFYLDFITVSYEINSFSNLPYNKFLYKTNIPSSSTIFKRIWLKYQQIKYQSDGGFILESIEETKFFKVEDYKTEIDLRKTNNKDLIWFTMQNYEYTTTYTRSYMKAQTLLADIGGIIRGLTLIGIFLNYSATNNLFNLSLINTIFDNENSFTKINAKTDKEEKNKLNMINPFNNSNINNNGSSNRNTNNLNINQNNLNKINNISNSIDLSKNNYFEMNTLKNINSSNIHNILTTNFVSIKDLANIEVADNNNSNRKNNKSYSSNRSSDKSSGRSNRKNKFVYYNNNTQLNAKIKAMKLKSKNRYNRHGHRSSKTFLSDNSSSITYEENKVYKNFKEAKENIQKREKKFISDNKIINDFMNEFNKERINEYKKDMKKYRKNRRSSNEERECKNDTNSISKEIKRENKSSSIEKKTNQSISNNYITKRSNKELNNNDLSKIKHKSSRSIKELTKKKIQRGDRNKNKSSNKQIILNEKRLILQNKLDKIPIKTSSGESIKKEINKNEERLILQNQLDKIPIKNSSGETIKKESSKFLRNKQINDNLDTINNYNSTLENNNSNKNLKKIISLNDTINNNSITNNHNDFNAHNNINDSCDNKFKSSQLNNISHIKSISYNDNSNNNILLTSPKNYLQSLNTNSDVRNNNNNNLFNFKSQTQTNKNSNLEKTAKPSGDYNEAEINIFKQGKSQKKVINANNYTKNNKNIINNQDNCTNTNNLFRYNNYLEENPTNKTINLNSSSTNNKVIFNSQKKRKSNLRKNNDKAANKLNKPSNSVTFEAKLFNFNQNMTLNSIHNVHPFNLSTYYFKRKEFSLSKSSILFDPFQCCLDKHRKQEYLRRLKQAEQCLNINNLITVIQELNLIKRVFLQEDQLLLLENLNKLEPDMDIMSKAYNTILSKEYKLTENDSEKEKSLFSFNNQRKNENDYIEKNVANYNNFKLLEEKNLDNKLLALVDF